MAPLSPRRKSIPKPTKDADKRRLAYAWDYGDGRILWDCRHSLGYPIDFHRPAHKTYIVISLHEAKHLGDREE